MSVRIVFVIVAALLVQVYSARVESSHFSQHVQTMKQQLKTKLNPSGMAPLAPNPHPTNNTHSATGFIFLTNSYNTDCSSPFLTYGVPVGQCIVEDNYAYVFNVVQDSCDGGTIQYFLDQKCTIATGNTDLEIGTNNCSIAANPIINDGARSIYTTLSCTSSADIPRISDNGAVIITEYVNTTTCDTKADYAYLAFTNRACIQIDNVTFVPDCVNGQPAMNYDTSSAHDCSALSGPALLPDSCVVDAGQPESDDEVYTPWFINPPPTISTTAFPTTAYVQANGSSVYACQASLEPSAEPSAAPTVKPSAEPSARPTAPSAVPSATPTAPTANPTATPSAVPTVRPSTRPTFAKTAYPTGSSLATATFSVSQVINGISYATYSSNVGLYSNTLISSIAASMQGVATTAIKNFNAVASPDTPHAVHGVQQGVNKEVNEVYTNEGVTHGAHLAPASRSLRRLQSSTSITTTYTVSTDSIYTADQLASQLSNAVTSGEFDNTLHTTATNNGATALTTASSGEVAVTYPSNKGGSNKLSDGALAGIIIGSVAGALLIGALLYYFFGGGKAALASQPHVEL